LRVLEPVVLEQDVLLERVAAHPWQIQASIRAVHFLSIEEAVLIGVLDGRIRLRGDHFMSVEEGVLIGIRELRIGAGIHRIDVPAGVGLDGVRKAVGVTVHLGGLPDGRTSRVGRPVAPAVRRFAEWVGVAHSGIRRVRLRLGP
jgi:hypothetical protein